MTEWYESDKGRALYGIESKSPAAAELRALGYRVEESEGPAPDWVGEPQYVVRCLWVLQPGECSRTWYLVDGEWSREPPQQVTGRVWGKVAALSGTTITFDTGPAITNAEVVPGNRRERRAAKARARHRN